MKEKAEFNEFTWLPSTVRENYFYLDEYEHLVVMKITEYSPKVEKEQWEAVIFENQKGETIVGREVFPSIEEAQKCLEDYVKISLANKKKQ